MMYRLYHFEEIPALCTFPAFWDRYRDKTDRFTLLSSQWACVNDTRLEKSLTPFLLGVQSTQTWFGYDYTNAPEGFARVMQVHWYMAKSPAGEILQTYAHDVFLSKQEGGSLEDLCLFQKDICLAWSISHERMLALLDDGTLALPKGGRRTEGIPLPCLPDFMR